MWCLQKWVVLSRIHLEGVDEGSRFLGMNMNFSDWPGNVSHQFLLWKLRNNHLSIGHFLPLADPFPKGFPFLQLAQTDHMRSLDGWQQRASVLASDYPPGKFDGMVKVPFSHQDL